MNIQHIDFYQKTIRFWKEHPLKSILLLAILLRLIAVIFAKGWGMLDDHFLVIEPAQSWVDGQDSDNWLPGSPGNKGPTGHNFLYPGIHFLLFSFFKIVGITDPQAKMMIIRLLHAAWSIITVYFGYKIAERLGGEKSARIAGLMLAIYWFMPWASVRNMVEVVCIPFLILAAWYIVREVDPKVKMKFLFIAGIFLGLAFNIRTQTAFFSIGIGFVFLFRRQWKELLALTIGALIPPLLIQGTIDYFIWGRPYAEIMGYVRGNIIDATSYINLPWYNYFFVVLGFLLPPVSFFLFFGYLRSWKKFLILFVPVALFFIFHSAFPNKQERFILPILPFIIILGSAGWNGFTEKQNIPATWKKWIAGSWVFFWIVNLILLAFTTVVYSKRARVETMVYLSKYKDLKYLLVADAGNSPDLFPKFYLGQWPYFYDDITDSVSTTDSLVVRTSKVPFPEQPRFILFSTEKELQKEVLKARKSFPFIVYETTIEPGFIDKFVRWLNPVNKNRRIYIYRNTLFFPHKHT